MATRKSTKATEAELVSNNGSSNKSDKSPQKDVRLVAADQLAPQPKSTNSRQRGYHRGPLKNNKDSGKTTSLPPEETIAIKRKPGRPRKRDQKGEHQLPPPLHANPPNRLQSRPNTVPVTRAPGSTSLARFFTQDGGLVVDLDALDRENGTDPDEVLRGQRGHGRCYTHSDEW